MGNKSQEGDPMCKKDVLDLLVLGILWIIFGTIIAFMTLEPIQKGPDPVWMEYHPEYKDGE